eukprot:366298-Chlamydomonas_euryale.AAC.15
MPRTYVPSRPNLKPSHYLPASARRVCQVFNDPDDWARDLQLIVDVLMSGGVPTRSEMLPEGARNEKVQLSCGPMGSCRAEGTPAAKCGRKVRKNYKYAQDLSTTFAGRDRCTYAYCSAGAAAVKLYFSNPDLLWSNDFPRNRFGQGAFAVAVQVWKTAGRCGILLAGVENCWQVWGCARLLKPGWHGTLSERLYAIGGQKNSSVCCVPPVPLVGLGFRVVPLVG